ncbi:hypothetical protein LTR85_002917 [Meristemomyces frigidus]|nr:hypothetical protein LTR85_002917 [Meristemomyces frigidus]
MRYAFTLALLGASTAVYALPTSAPVGGDSTLAHPKRDWLGGIINGGVTAVDNIVNEHLQEHMKDCPGHTFKQCPVDENGNVIPADRKRGIWDAVAGALVPTAVNSVIKTSVDIADGQQPGDE